MRPHRLAVFAVAIFTLVLFLVPGAESNSTTVHAAAASPPVVVTLPQLPLFSIPVPTTSTTTTPAPTTTTVPEPPPTTAPPPPTTTEPAPAPEPVAGYSSMEPCGGDLPPCYVKYRESKGDYTALNRSSGASGAWQFLDSTWAGYGGYAKAMYAPPEVQDQKARELWDGGNGCSHWSACS